MSFIVTVNETRLTAHFDQFPKLLQEKLRIKITELTQTLLAQVKAREPRRTGRLVSLTRSYVDTRPNFVRGRVRVLRTRDHNTAAAAGALEYGAHRSFAVHSHRRGSVRVSAYHRRANISAQRFLRGPAAAMLPRARAELEATIAAAIAEANKT